LGILSVSFVNVVSLRPACALCHCTQLCDARYRAFEARDDARKLFSGTPTVNASSTCFIKADGRDGTFARQQGGAAGGLDAPLAGWRSITLYPSIDGLATWQNG
jgi:hypothetical protein